MRLMREVSIAAAVLVLAAAHAVAQDIQWANGVNGNWDDVTKWNPQNIPNNASENARITAAGAYTVTMNGYYFVGELSITQPTVHVDHLGGLYLVLNGNMVNAGIYTINSNLSTSNAFLRFDGGDYTISGTGQIVMVLGSADLNDARIDTNAATITQAVGHTIRGAGTIGAALTNNGTIIAEGDQQTLQFKDSPKTNNGLIEATAGATLQLNTGAPVTQGHQGVILAEDGRVNLVAATVTGGTISTSGQGQVRASNFNTLNAVDNEGAVGINDGSYIVVHGGMTNNGVITVNPDGGASNAVLRFDNDPQTLDGEGAVILKLGSADLNDAQLGTNGSTLTVGAGQTIRGSGRFTGNSLVTVQGTLVPGDSEVGQFDVQGSIALDPSAVCKADIAAANSFDQLTVSGVATVGGEVNISLLNGFVPDTCFAVPIVTAGSVQGAFDTVRGDPGNGRVWRIAYTATQAKAIVTCYADMAVDCQLDLFDFLAFVNLFNDNDPAADCTADGSFDLFDFLCFVNAFNQGC